MSNHISRVTLITPQEYAEVYAAAIESHCDSVGWTVGSGQLNAKVTGFSDSPIEKKKVIQAVFCAASANNILAPEVKISRIPVRNWVIENVRQFVPIVVGRYFIYGSDSHKKIPTSSIPLNIPAGGAFGTGEHGSTRGCLIAFGRLKDRSIHSALDMGCGSGILAIAIAKRWRCKVIASDVDPVAVAIAKRNVIANGAVRFVRVVEGADYQNRLIGKERFNLVVCNILAGPLERMSYSLRRCLSSRGTAVVSGLLVSQESQVIAAHRRQGLMLTRLIRSDEWSTLIMSRCS